MGPLPQYSRWELLSEEQRGGIMMQKSSLPKDTHPGWTNQDATIACCPVSPDDDAHPSGCAPVVFGVFDGHGRFGHTVSRLCSQRIPGHLMKQDNILENPKKAFEAAFRDMDEEIFDHMQEDAEFSGTTAVVVLFDPTTRTLHTANVGDSRAILGCNEGSSWSAVALTEDLKPDLDEEKRRIQQFGGHVSPIMEDGEAVGPARVWEDVTLTKPGLACSRSVGDGCAKRAGVICDPVVTTHKLTPGQTMLLLATDGLWDSVGNDEAVRIVSKFTCSPQDALEALNDAVRQAEDNELPDDTTIVLVTL